ncbi:DUF1800 domain-containing protein [Ferruginibacter sp. SUN002]|uniref:DUF1800 domain-containing protein n=1 Tax=Ferruginibacter sp. SUN002 TaxID=2937789 RepID=UPI003D36391A
MAISNRLKNQHLLWRAAFGPMAEMASDLDTMSQKKLWELLLSTSKKEPVKLNIASKAYDDYLNDMILMGGDTNKLTKDQRKALQDQSKDDLKLLNVTWMGEMINSEAQFREKMSLFWHGHFACRVIHIFNQQDLLHIIRANALGNFGELLRQVSKSPSMLQFLNNQQNKKQHPNENFAREVMELFTMGRGNYTETDIKEAARAFTGWSFDVKGNFIFREKQHDKGVKTILGKTGNFNGDDVINILLEQKQTATYITKKIYKYFVNDAVDDAKVDWLSKRFYTNGYDIKKLMEDIFTSDWFYDGKNIGTKIKSPIELLVGLRRLLPLQFQNDAAQLLFQRALGQVLFYPPNVAGWPGGKTWIDSSTLMLRLRIPQIITANETINIKPKGDDDTMMGQMMEEKIIKKQNKEYASKGGSAIVDWVMVVKIFEKVSKEELLKKISDTVLQTKSRINNDVLEKYLNKESRENYVKSSIINLMSTPEYQLC